MIELYSFEQTLSNVPKSLPVLGKAHAYEAQLSRLLRDVNLVKCEHEFVLVTHYVQQLRILTLELENYLSSDASSNLFYKLDSIDLTLVRYYPTDHLCSQAFRYYCWYFH